MSRPIVFLVFPDFQILDLTGPLEVFSQAERMQPHSYTLRTVALDPGPVASSSGLAVSAQTAPAGGPDGPAGRIDTLVVAGGRGVGPAAADPRYGPWIAETSRAARRTASVCTGAFLLAQAGLLDGRRATTHWDHGKRLAERYPAVTVDPEPIFVRDGPVWTSAGVTAGIDLALALVEDDHGPRLARAVARQLVVFLQRPGGQAQFSAHLAGPAPDLEPLRRVQAYIAEHPEADLSLPALAAKAGLSERHLTRVFRARIGATPASYVEAARVETARRLLESTHDTLDRVARRAGFHSAATMHRAFQRTLRITPGQYRDRFGAAEQA